jgi:hypothetical protein
LRRSLAYSTAFALQLGCHPTITLDSPPGIEGARSAVVLVKGAMGRVELAQAIDLQAGELPELSSNQALTIEAAYFRCSLADLGLPSGTLQLGDAQKARALPAPIAAQELELPGTGAWTGGDAAAADADLRVLALPSDHFCQISKARYQVRSSSVVHGSEHNVYSGSFARVDSHRVMAKVEPTSFYLASASGVVRTAITVDGSPALEEATCLTHGRAACPPGELFFARDGTVYGYRRPTHDIVDGQLLDGPGGPTLAFENRGYPAFPDPNIYWSAISPTTGAPDGSELVVWVTTTTGGKDPTARAIDRFLPGQQSWAPEPVVKPGTLLEHGARDIGPSVAWVGPRQEVASVGTADCRCVARYRGDTLSIEQTVDRVTQVATTSVGTLAGTWEGQILLDSGGVWSAIVTTSSTGGLPVSGIVPLKDGFAFSTSAGRGAGFIEFSKNSGVCPADGEVPGRVHAMGFVDDEQHLVVLSQELVSNATSAFPVLASPVLSVLDRVPPPDCLTP